MRPVHAFAVAAAVTVGGYLVLRPSEAPASVARDEPGAEQRVARRVDGPEARRLVSEGATLLDVRTPGEYAEGHVEGALNVPVQELDRRLSEVPRGHPVVVYCLSGGRSAAASRMLSAAGYEAHDLGPMSAW